MARSKPATAHRPSTEGVLCQLSGQSDPWVLASHLVGPDVRAMSWAVATRERDRIDRACRLRGLAWNDACCYYRQLVQHVTNLTLGAYADSTVAEIEARSWWDAMCRARAPRRPCRTPENGWFTRDYDGIGDSTEQTAPRHIGTGVWGAGSQLTETH